MTALNFIFDSENVYIAMDTLSITVDEKKPFKFASKIFPLPHLRSVMCGTGNIDLILDWNKMINRNVISYDIDYLNILTTEALRNLNSQYPKEVTSTIFQFGYSHKQNAFRGFVYRSTNDFNVEEYEYCAAIKPQVSFDFYEELSIHGVDEMFIKLITLQKYEDDLSKDKVGIGGEIHRFIMSKDSNQLDIIYRFPDHEEHYRDMISNLN
ncbi:hypothetical protein [Paenibacillus glacialis]|uniref:Uncharacterized protein n=1 Tax=Paenibacillus glacialis TaxID=494026 RepID=A0A168NP82_9BACL|nr:hypothetical protein [Paenibacillus glacialis]OAB45990.1 hypothetical protein PGLA_00915 [Paenibacillus glacialis]